MSGSSWAGTGRLMAEAWPRGRYVLADLLAWAISLVLVSVYRYDLSTAQINRSGLLIAIAIALGGQFLASLYQRRRYRYATIDEIVILGLTVCAIATVLVIVAVLTNPRLLPVSAALAAPAAALCLMIATRWAYVRAGRRLLAPDSRVKNTLVLGAGSGGAQAIGMMLADPDSALKPVGILDDDPSRRYLRISGVRVLGTVDDIVRVAGQTEAQVAVLAIPSATSSQVNRAAALVRKVGLELKVLPRSSEILATRSVSEQSDRIELPTRAFRSLEIRDLLGRSTVDTDVAAIAGYLGGAVVLVTGAGGSIGSQLCREISRFSPARLVMTDRDESALHAVQLSLDGVAMLDSENLVLGDLRRPGFVEQLIGTVRPQIVFHAAALKHLPLLEQAPVEGFLTNVGATADLLAACATHDVERFVHISTDKAADPTSVLGYTKRISERLTATVGNAAGSEARYISVRFGNVLGSRGSVLTTFAAQLEAGLPLTITAPGMTRYFMSPHEACELVLQAGAIGRSGEVLVLDMGEPHTVEDIARRFAALQGYSNVEVTYTHRRPGEKIVETRLATGEPDHRPRHPLITHIEAPALEHQHLATLYRQRTELAAPGAEQQLASWLRQAAGIPADEPR